MTGRTKETASTLRRYEGTAAGLVGLRLVALTMTMVMSASSVPQAQFLKRVTKLGACGLGGAVGLKVADRVAEFEATRLHLDAATAAEHKRSFQIGFALAGCGGAAALAGTAYARLSERGKAAREREILAALDDAKPRAYADPDNPTLQGTVTAQPSIVDGDQECRIVQDQLPPDHALIKYCRKGAGPWAVKAM